MSLFRSSATSDGKKLSISADTEHVWLQTTTKTLFVRSCYADIWNKVRQHYQIAKDNPLASGGAVYDGFVVSGTPGVGKSCFLDFCLHNLLQLGKSVCYFHGKTTTAQIHKPDGTVESYKVDENVKGWLAEQVDFLLIDPPENGDANFLGGRWGLAKKPYILSVSPDRNNCQAIRKETTHRKLYMGTCSSKEAEEMRVACYPEIPQRRVQLRYAEFGGIARTFFQEVIIEDGVDTGLEQSRSQQRTALMDVVANPNRIDNLENADPFKSIWTIFHMEPVQLPDGAIDYSSYSIQPCCQDAAIRIRDHLMQKGVKDLWAVFTSTREDLGTLRGIRFEAYAHKKLLVDGLAGSATALTQTGLSKSAPKAITVPPGSTQINLPTYNVDNDLASVVQKVRSGHDGYLLPHLSNFPVVDSIFVPSGSGAAINLQMKAGRSRPVATDKAASIAAATGNTDMYFIVPDDVTMTRKLAGLDGWRQYRVVLKER